jgi:xylulose-5-phosphate/fructose-6-phosphate phosphoketolase
MLRRFFPELKIRVVNVVDLMTLQPSSEHPHGLSDRDFDSIFTTDKPIIFAFHGYPWLIHRLTYRRNNHKNLHVRGYKEEGTTTTPFDNTTLLNTGTTCPKFAIGSGIIRSIIHLLANGDEYSLFADKFRSMKVIKERSLTK